MSSDANSSVTIVREARRARARQAKAAQSVATRPLTAATSPQTVRGYTDSVRWLCRFLAKNDMPADVEGAEVSTAWRCLGASKGESRTSTRVNAFSDFFSAQA